ncbi:6520_t:CDS:2 [Entrophospora sp. SA101]|nr:6520_t:CDS:2 [Entrophospora sp. SA101]
MVRDILNSSYEELEKKKRKPTRDTKRKKRKSPLRRGEERQVARFISEPIYQEVSFMKFYKAVLENKEGKFTCSFGIEFLENNEPLTSWEETSRTESKAIKEESKQEIQEKLKIVIKVITGQHRGKIDYISRLDRKNQIVYLKKVSRKKYDKSTAESKEKKELKEIMVPLSLSNVAYWLEDKKKITKIGFQIVDGKKLPGNKDFNTILRMALNHATKELSGYFWECLPVSKKTINRPFNFPNQRKDSVLVIPIPKPGPDLDFKNISQFTKNAPDEQQQAF